MSASTNESSFALQDCKQIVVLLGAGISTNAGIPDFRSRDGLYAKYGEDLFDRLTLHYEPERIYRFLREYFANDYQPTAAHKALKVLQDRGLLRRTLTQNIDGLEEKAGLEAEQVLYLHGSLTKFRCVNNYCNGTLSGDEYRQYCTDSEKPLACYYCNGANLMRPDIVLFGEPLDETAVRLAENDLARCDAFVCIGTSLKVNPVASMPLEHVQSSAKRIWINREPPPASYNGFFTYQWFGECDEMVQRLVAPLSKDRPE